MVNKDYQPELNDHDMLVINSFDPTVAAKEFMDPLLSISNMELEHKKISMIHIDPNKINNWAQWAKEHLSSVPSGIWGTEVRVDIVPTPEMMHAIDKEIERFINLRLERYNKSVYVKAHRTNVNKKKVNK